jgi:hypothetical protein
MLSRSCFVYSFCSREFCHQRRTVLLLSPVNALASPPHGRPFSQVKKEHRPVLPVGELRPFIKLTSAYREQGGGLPSPKRFDWKKSVLLYFHMFLSLFCIQSLPMIQSSVIVSEH